MSHSTSTSPQSLFVYLSRDGTGAQLGELLAPSRGMAYYAAIERGVVIGSTAGRARYTHALAIHSGTWHIVSFHTSPRATKNAARRLSVEQREPGQWLVVPVIRTTRRMKIGTPLSECERAPSA